MKHLIPILALAAFLWSCDNSAKTADKGDQQDSTAVTANDAGRDDAHSAGQKEVFPDPDATGNFGAAVSAEGAMDVSQLSGKLSGQDSLQVKVQGVVKAVCQAKGCWMTLPLANDEDLMVKFKDYAFFMPKNCAGKTAVVQGWAYRELVSVDELRHYAEDEGLPKEEVEKITEPKERLTFMADGVVIEE